MRDAAVIAASPADYDRSIAALVAAFVADPFIRWMFPDARQYLRWFPLVLKHFAGGAFAQGSAYRSSDFKAAALWLPPGVGPDEEALGVVIAEGVDRELRDEVLAVLEQVGAGHPQQAHWYLPAIGVDPPGQGKGYGSALLACGLEACDRDHAAAYLEATHPVNVPLYQRFGFSVIGRIQAGSSPAIVPMLRAAR